MPSLQPAHQPASRVLFAFAVALLVAPLAFLASRWTLAPARQPGSPLLASSHKQNEEVFAHLSSEANRSTQQLAAAAADVRAAAAEARTAAAEARAAVEEIRGAVAAAAVKSAAAPPAAAAAPVPAGGEAKQQGPAAAEAGGLSPVQQEQGLPAGSGNASNSVSSEGGGGAGGAGVQPAEQQQGSTAGKAGSVPEVGGGGSSNDTALPEGARKLRAMQAAAQGPAGLSANTTRVFPPGNVKGECVGQGADTEGVVAPVVVVAFNRVDYLNRTLGSLLSVHASSPHNKRAFPIFVSQDGDSPGVQDLVWQHLDSLRYMQHVERPGDSDPDPGVGANQRVYYKIANHWRFVLTTLFECFGYKRVLYLEDDMLFSPDFFSYFEALAPRLDADPTLMCVSAWNDHGQQQFVRDPRRLMRTDYFPGLGWMTNRATWDSIKDRVGRSFWDDMLRRPATRQGRQCIIPEVSRDFNIGEWGSSCDNQGCKHTFDDWLSTIKLNEEPVDWAAQDLSYLEPERYARELDAALAAARQMRAGGADAAAAAQVAWGSKEDSVLRYDSMEEYAELADALQFWEDWREGVPRAGYRGVITIRNPAGALLYVAPTEGFLESHPGLLPQSGAGG